MRLLILPFLLALASLAHADSIARSGDNWVRIAATPCEAAQVVQHIEAAGDDPKDFRAASARVGGQEFVGCWRPDFANRMVYMRYEDGDDGFVPFDDLKPMQGI